MANDVANIIIKKVIEMDKEDIYLFNGNIYKKRKNTSDNEFTKFIIQHNYEKCVKLLFKIKHKITGKWSCKSKKKPINCCEGENVINIEDFHLTVDEWKNLVFSFEKKKWFVFREYKCPRICPHFKPRNPLCLCDTQRAFRFKNKTDFADKLIVEEDDDDRVVWGNQCEICHGFTERIVHYCKLCSCHIWDIDCCCEGNYTEYDCEICDLIIPPSITILSEYIRLGFDRDVAKKDFYNIFISAEIDILKNECVALLKPLIHSKKLTINLF